VGAECVGRRGGLRAQLKLLESFLGGTLRKIIATLPRLFCRKRSAPKSQKVGKH